MDTLLILLGLAGLVFGVVNLARPTGRLGISSRTAAGWLTAGSVVVMLIGGAVASPADEAGTEAGPSTTTAPTTSTTALQPTSTTMLSPTTTTTAEAPTTTTTAGGEQPDTTISSGTTGEPATVISITDGDTIDVSLEDGSRDTVRLIGINAPEIGECWAEEAGRTLEELVPPGTEVGMTRDQSNRDQFGRLLRYLWVGSTSVNEELVRLGAVISRRYPPDTAMAEILEAAQVEAEAAGAGLWAPDACGPSSNADLAVAELRYNADGNDNENLNDEWVVVVNQGNEPADLTGWLIKDESSTHRFWFAAGTVLGPGATLTVHTGCGQISESAQYWCAKGSAVWNNDGDTAFLIDPAGNTHFSYTYSP